LPGPFPRPRTMKTLIRISSLLLLLAGALSATPTTTLIAQKGDPIGNPSDNTTLTMAGPPAVDAAGDIALRVLVSGTTLKKDQREGIVLYTGSTLQMVAKLGQADPITGGTFAKLSDPALSGSGALAFIGTLKKGGTFNGTNDTGVYVSKNGSLFLAAAKGRTAISGTKPKTFTGFDELAIDNAGGVFFFGSIRGQQGGHTPALFGTDANGVLQLIVAKGHGEDRFSSTFFPFRPLPYVQGQSRTVDTVNGNVTVVGKLDNPTQSIGLAVSGTDGFTEKLIADTSHSGTIPNLPGVRIKALGEPTVNANTSVAFHADLLGSGVTGLNNQAIGLVTGSTQGVVVRTGDFAPDISGSTSALGFKKLSDPVLNNNDHIAFLGTLKTGSSGVTGSTDTGIWSDWDGSMKLIVREGDLAPGGGGGSFSSIKQLVLPDVGGPIFLATLSGVPAVQNTGVWAVAPDGTLTMVVKTGATLDTKTVKSITIFPLAQGAIGQSRSFDTSTGKIVYQANFTDGSWGIYLFEW